MTEKILSILRTSFKLRILILAVAVLLVVITSANPVANTDIKHNHKQEYFDEKKAESLHEKVKSDKQVVYVHLVPHSHDDVGWLKTLYEYFWGIHDDVQRANVHLIIDAAITELLKNPERKFTYVEMAFFSRWWELQTDKRKEEVKNLIQEGRLEIINAGWSMNDEACPYYTQIIENMMIGHKFLKEEFGVSTNIGWHVDPFGHSSANAALFADMGIDAFFYSRLDYQDKEKRLEEKSMEYIWRPFPEDKGSSGEIFTHALYSHYYPPSGFCWETTSCSYYDEPIIDDKNLKTYNYKERIAEFYQWVSHMKDHYRSNHLLITMGGDFFYKNAYKQYTNIDKLIKYFNEEYDDFKLIYSTPGYYLKSVHASNTTFPIVHADQFPYAEEPFSYWTGYFTSRAVAKGNIREFDRFVQIKNSLWTKSILNKDTDKNTKEQLLKNSEEGLRVIGVTQHHDAITGTAKQKVADDYQNQIDSFYNSTKAFISQTIKTVLKHNFGENSIDKVSVCFKNRDKYIECNSEVFKNTSKNKFIILYKKEESELVRIKLPSSTFKLVIPEQIQNSEPRQAIYCYDDGCSLYMQDFKSGFTIYKVVYDDRSTYLTKANSCNRIRTEYQSLMFVRGYENSIFAWYVNCDTPKEDPFFGDKSDCAERNISLSFRYYNSYEGRDQPSGAYVFRPENGTIDTKPYGNYIGFGCYNESDWLQTFQILTDKGSIFMRMIKGDRLGLQVETQFGGIELSDVGTEVTLNIKALGFNNSQQFYTDSNGLQFQYRKIDYRPTWNVSLTETEHISGNYYPINSAITMIDNYRGEIITYLNDRSQGGSALKADRLELMIDRRLYVDDEKGVGEALNETDIHGNPLPVTTHGILLLERSIKNYSNLYGYSRIKAAQRRLASTTVVGIFDTSNDILSNSIYQSYPSNSNSSFIIQVYPVAFDEIIVRLENPEDYLTHPNMTYINYDINAIAKSIYEDANSGRSPAAIKIQEVALSASETSQEREKHRLSWKVEENKYSKSIEKEEGKLHRQEMKTFRIKYAHNNDEAIQATF